MGIDYGRIGQSNRNTETGIHYGVIPLNDLCEGAFDTFFHDGTDVDFEGHKDELKRSLASAIEAVLKESGHDSCNDSESLAAEIVDNMQWDAYESCDGTRYDYVGEGYHLDLHRDGDVFVLESPYYTFAPFCSPCAPGAGYLRNGAAEGDCKTYCLGADWFEDEKVPYPIYRVSDDSPMS